MGKTTIKKVSMSLVGIDGNAFSLLGAFSRKAREQGWARADINEVIKLAMAGNYDNLIAVLCDHIYDPLGREDDE